MNEEHIKSMVERGIHGEDDGFTIIPDAVLEDGSLSPTEILLFCRISKMGKCWASNAWFASKMNKSETWVSKSINSLIKKGYVEHVGFTGRFRIIRAIKDLNSTSRVEQKFNGGLNKSSRQGRTRVQPESTDKNKEENTSIAKAIGETPKSAHRTQPNINSNHLTHIGGDTAVSKKYYQVVKKYGLPVRNHNNLRQKIKEMEGIPKSENFLDFLLQYDYDSIEVDFKPELNEALDIYAKMNQIINQIKRQQSKKPESVSV